jgi:hypothetical protein
MEATVNTPIPLSMLVADGTTTLYGQARIYNSLGSLSYTVDLNHVAEGIYVGLHTPTLEGYYQIVYQLYTDISRTIPATYDKSGESLDVNSFRTNILRLLGLAHENSVLDAMGYDIDGNMTSARVRCYDNRTHADLARAASPATYNTGLLFSYDVSATYASGNLSKYSILKSL